MKLGEWLGATAAQDQNLFTALAFGPIHFISLITRPLRMMAGDQRGG